MPDDKTARVGVNRENKPAATVVSGVAALGTVLAAAGISEGVVGRMAREEEFWFALAFIAALLAGLLGVIAALFTTQMKRERGLLVASNILLFVGLAAGAYGAARVWSSTRVPSVTATPQVTTAGTFLNVNVKDSGLDSREHVTLLVEPLVVRSRHLRPLGTVYSASLGSDDDGKIDRTVRVRLRDGYQGFIGVRAYTGALPTGCYQNSRSAGCIVNEVVNLPERPQLKTHWNKGGKSMTVSVSARQVPGRDLSMRVLGRRGRSNWREVAYWHLAPADGGAFQRSYVVRGIRALKALCVVASTSGKTSCPPRPGDPNTVWARYRMP
jgi:hypothetical protein